MKVSHCTKFIDVYLLTRKLLKGTTIGNLACLHSAHFRFYAEICHETQNDFHKNKKIQTFCVIACPRSIRISAAQKGHDLWKALEICFKT